MFKIAEIIYHLPSYYLKSNIINNITQAFDNEIKLLDDYKEDTQKQFIVNTSTKSLKDYEFEYGLPVEPNLSLDERRSRVMARMRGFGTCTKAMVKKIVDSWTNGDVEIIEFLTHYELNKQYTHEQLKQFTHAKLSLNDYEFKIVFNNEVGIPPNMKDVYNAIEEIKPAHLNVRYEFKYRRHQELTSKTHQQLNSYTHNTIRQGVI